MCKMGIKEYVYIGIIDMQNGHTSRIKCDKGQALATQHIEAFDDEADATRFASDLAIKAMR